MFAPPFSRPLAASLILGLGLAIGGCGDQSPAAEDVAASESFLVTQTRLDRVTPQEIASLYASWLVPDVARCVAGHPEMTAIDKSHVEGFYRVGVSSYWNVRDFVSALLDENGNQPIAVGDLAGMIEPWAIAQLSRSVDADGFYERPVNGGLRFYSAEYAAREEKALVLAKSPGGTSLREVREMWREVEREQGNLDSAWLSPVQLSSDLPSIGDVRRAMRIPFEVRYVSWGTTAIAEFHESGEGPDESALFDPIADLLRGSSIKKRWFFEGGGDEWSAHYLVVLDEHLQLWGFMMGYSE